MLLLHAAAAPRLLLIQQATIAIVAIAATLISVRYSTASSTQKSRAWLLLGLAALVYTPFLSGASPNPQRWLGLFGFRLYIAPVVLPLFLLLWYRMLSRHEAKTGIASAAATAAFIAVGLLLQPDAAQLTAFAAASVPILWCSNIGRLGRLVMIVSLLVAAAVSWTVPDALAPVSYVEGVFLLAASFSAWLLLVAVLAVALPVFCLGSLAYKLNSAGVLGVAIYFAVLYLLAPIQVTPVPLLGFGAGPILGYFIIASQVEHRNVNAA
jgi:cell division protein FtsW (lipid II flippase)